METASFFRRSIFTETLPVKDTRFPASELPVRRRVSVNLRNRDGLERRSVVFRVSALENNNVKKAVPNSNYVVPLDNPPNSSCLTRPLVEILRDLNKRVPDKIIKGDAIPWYHANRMLSFYAPGWCGEIRNILVSDNECVTVVYRLTVRGSDGEAYRDASGTVSLKDGQVEDPVAAAEGIAFCRACARFGLGLYLYHEDETR